MAESGDPFPPSLSSQMKRLTDGGEVHHQLYPSTAPLRLCSRVWLQSEQTLPGGLPKEQWTLGGRKPWCQHIHNINDHAQAASLKLWGQNNSEETEKIVFHIQPSTHRKSKHPDSPHECLTNEKNILSYNLYLIKICHNQILIKYRLYD